MTDPFCYACGANLAPEAERCASCGAPRRAKGARRGTGRTTIAAFLLFSLFVLTLVQGIFFASNPDASLQSPIQLTNRNLSVSGRVVDPTDRPVANATVAAAQEGGASTQTGPDGTFTLRPLPAGVVTVRAMAPGHGTTDVRLFLTHDRNITMNLAPESETRVVEHASYATLAGIVRACGFGVIGIALLLLAGTIAAGRRRNYRLAVSASVLGLIGSIPVSLILGLIVILLLVKSRSEFR